MTKPSLDSWPEIVAEREEEITELRLEVDLLRAELERLRTPWRVQLDSYRVKNNRLRALNWDLRNVLEQLVIDYEGVPDATDKDGQDVFAQARAILAKAKEQPARSEGELDRVRALNADLVEALEELSNGMWAGDGVTTPAVPGYQVARARAILARAKEQP